MIKVEDGPLSLSPLTEVTTHKNSRSITGLRKQSQHKASNYYHFQSQFFSSTLSTYLELHLLKQKINVLYFTVHSVVNSICFPAGSVIHDDGPLFSIFSKNNRPIIEFIKLKITTTIGHGHLHIKLMK